MILLINHARLTLFVLFNMRAVLLLLSGHIQSQPEKVLMSTFPLDVLQAKHQNKTLLTVLQGLLQAENRNQALWSSDLG